MHLLPLVAAALVSHSTVDPVTGARTFRLWDGSTATVSADGVAVATRPDRKRGANRLVAPWTPPGAGDLSLFRMLSLPTRGLAPQRVTAGMRSDFYVGSMSTAPVPLDDATTVALSRGRAAVQPVEPTAGGVPSNYGLSTSLQAHLNAAGVNAIGAFVDLAQRFGQLPGQGIRITNVSVGDLTDQSMADAGDFYVQTFGVNSRVINGQRYLDYPSMPLIPTWTSDASGHLDPLGTVEFVDPYQSEILLDFSVMAPLPSALQRPEALGSGRTDLLGIAPGAQYRLVVPQDPTMTNIYTAMLAAATQQPRPDVITASLGFGFDGVGFPGRYLEDDPVGQSVIASIVKMGIVVCISANDGTRLFTPAAIGPDGGSAPTDRLRQGETPTSVADDFLSTVATRVADSGAIAVGGTTLDDIFSAGRESRTGVFPATRFNGSTGFSTGFGTRIDLSAPSDGIVSLLHVCLNWPDCQPQDAIPVLSGGTSASAPMVAAAAAIVLQGARLMHKSLTPAQVRDILVKTGRPIAQAPQSGRVLAVGTQLDVTAALESVIGKSGSPSIARISVSHRRELGALGAEFEEDVDRSAIDLSGPWTYGPITIAADVTNPPAGAQYRLTIGSLVLTSATPSFRLMPAEIIGAGGGPTADVRFELVGKASASTTLTFLPGDGIVDQPLAPIAPPVANEGDPVVIHYDVRNVRTLDSPVLVVSGVGHFSPVAAPLYHADREIPLPGVAGDLVIPPSAFRSGAGLYGIAIRPQTGNEATGQFAIIRIAAVGSGRPEAPVISDGSDALGHFAVIRSASPRFRVRWDASAFGPNAVLEISAPAPTLRNSYNTFTNQNGDARDADGVNSGSVVYVPIAAHGDQVFDAAQLGLSGGMIYSVRVFAAKNGKPASEASATSALEIDDVPVAGLITSFDLAGASSTVATASFDFFGMLTESDFSRWSPSTGDLTTLAADTSGFLYEDIGSDGVVTMAARWPWTVPTSMQTLETWRVGSAAREKTLDVDAFQAFLLSSRVDPVRRRAVFLAFDADFNEILQPYDMATLTAGAPVLTPTFGYTAVSLDPSNGKAWLASLQFSEFCLFRGLPLGQVDVTTGDAITVDVAHCSTGMVSDGKQVQLVDGPLLSNGVLLPEAQIQRVNEQTLKATNPALLGGRSPLFPAIDPVNRLLFVAFVAGEDFGTNNNATSVVSAFEMNSGARLWSSNAFNFARAAFGPVLDTMPMRGIQLDPKTRTGWTFGPDAAQLQRFRY